MARDINDMNHKNNKNRLTLFSLALGIVIAVISRGYQSPIDANGAARKNQNAPLVQRFTMHKPIARQTVIPYAEMYPYHSPKFTRFVDESYQSGHAGESREFYTWMTNAYASSQYRYPGRETLGLEALLSAKKQDFTAMSDPSMRAKAEMEWGAWLHRMVKTTITKFSLDRGFEFYNVVGKGERQCFLQSILIAGMLQSTGVRAGVVMINKGTQGLESNNGHATVLVKLSDGCDIIVDASEREPFARQQGLFVSQSSYTYVKPIYEAGTGKILYYRSVASGTRISTRTVRTLDYDFLRSQFWYYRGERAPSGILASHRTPGGLKASERALATSVSICQENPLAVYMLGRVHYAEGHTKKARALLNQANRLYSRFGWVPVGPKEFLALVKK